MNPVQAQRRRGLLNIGLPLTKLPHVVLFGIFFL
jgi:hypothetical protein